MKLIGSLCLLLLCVAAPAAENERADLAAALRLKPDLARGAELFNGCVACHGADGGGVTTGSVPRIAGQHYRVLLRQLVDFRHGRRWDMRMEGIATSHSIIPELQDLADVAGYVSGLNANGVRGVGDGNYLEAGAKVYAARCASCHGREAQGESRGDSKGDKGAETPRLAGQHAAYLMRQVYDAVDGRRPQLTRTHQKLLAPLKFEEVLGLTDYLSRIGWNPQDAEQQDAEIPPG